MRGLVGIVIFLFLAVAAQAQPLSDRPVNPAELSLAEKRFVQAMLAHGGGYQGLLDGVWGPMTQAALAAQSGHARPTLGDLAAIARPFRKTLEAQEWGVVAVDGASRSYLLPLALVARADAGSEVIHADQARSLVVRSRTSSIVDTVILHRWLVNNAQGNDPGYHFILSNRIVTSRKLRDGSGWAYIRSDRRGSNYATTLVQWTPDRQAEARLIIASIADGRQEMPDLPKGGIMRRTISDMRDTRDGDDPQGRPGRLAGTGFFINNTDLVTAEDVLARCGRLALRDGGVLTALKAKAAPGLAVLSAPKRSAAWLSIDPEGGARPDDPVAVVGFPSGDAPEPARIDGHILQEFRTAGGERRLILSAPARQALAGAPALNRRGQVVGVILGDTAGRGVVATPGERLAGMLAFHRIQFDTRQRWPTSEVEAAPRWSDTADAVVALFCR